VQNLIGALKRHCQQERLKKREGRKSKSSDKSALIEELGELCVKIIV